MHVDIHNAIVQELSNEGLSASYVSRFTVEITEEGSYHLDLKDNDSTGIPSEVFALVDRVVDTQEMEMIARGTAVVRETRRSRVVEDKETREVIAVLPKKLSFFRRLLLKIRNFISKLIKK